MSNPTSTSDISNVASGQSTGSVSVSATKESTHCGTVPETTKTTKKKHTTAITIGESETTTTDPKEDKEDKKIEKKKYEPRG